MNKYSLYTTIIFFSVCIIFFSITHTSCTKSDDTTSTPQDAGKWMFWTDSTMYTPHITVRIDDGLGGSVTGYITGVCDSLPYCDDIRCFTVKLNSLGISDGHREGTFYYEAIDSLSPTKWHTWKSAIIVTKDNWVHCNSTLLH